MNILTEPIDGVIGVDTHRDTLAAAAVTAIGAVVASTQAAASADGYQYLLRFALGHLPNRRCWAVEGTGSYGAGLTEFLLGQGERVVEVCRPNAHRGEAAERVMRWMLSGPPARSSAAITSSNRAAAGIARPCGF